MIWKTPILLGMAWSNGIGKSFSRRHSFHMHHQTCVSKGEKWMVIQAGGDVTKITLLVYHSCYYFNPVPTFEEICLWNLKFGYFHWWINYQFFQLFYHSFDTVFILYFCENKSGYQRDSNNKSSRITRGKDKFFRLFSSLLSYLDAKASLFSPTNPNFLHRWKFS